MADSVELGNVRKRKCSQGHHYEHVRVSDNARVHLGDSYHIGLDNPLDYLAHAKDAPFNSFGQQHEPDCLPDTRVSLLEEIYSWADGRDKPFIFWLSGLAGTGKSTIARTVSHHYHDNQRLGASFFFSRGGGDVGHADRFVTSIAYQLACNVQELRQHINCAVAEQRDIGSKSLREQWNYLVLGPLSKLEGPQSYVLVIDALDECDNDDNIEIIVQLVAEARKTWLRVLITSRPELPMRRSFSRIAVAEHQVFILHDILPSVIDDDISVFLRHEFRLIAQRWDQAPDWPGENIITQLRRNASGLFIWAATACRFIQQGGQFVDDRIQDILRVVNCTKDSDTDNSSIESSCADDTPAILPEMRLNDMYLAVLKSPLSKYSTREKQQWYNRTKEILGAIILLLSPLSTASLATLLQIDVLNVHRRLLELHSILNISEKEHGGPLRLHHPSFRDFLLNKDRCGDNFWVDEKQGHAELAGHCIKLMSKLLKRDICGVDDPGMLVIHTETHTIERTLAPELQYACLYWVQHVQRSGERPRDDGKEHLFLQKHLLHWIEVLGWIGKISEAVHTLSSLEMFVSPSYSPTLSALIHDAGRYILYTRAAIERAPLQTYYGLIFAPTSSIVRNIFEDSMPRWIRKQPIVEENWNALLQTLEGCKSVVTAVAFSPDSLTLAAALENATIEVREARTGTLQQNLKGHKRCVDLIAFSPDSATLASALNDRTIELWKVRTGTLWQTFKWHGWGSLLRHMAFLPDGRTLALALSDNIVKLWEARTGAMKQTIQGHGHEGYVSTVAFSPDGTAVASALINGPIKLWELKTGALLQTFQSREKVACAVSFSRDGTTLASVSKTETVELWETKTGALQRKLTGYAGGHTAVAFSPDGKTLAAASASGPHVITIALWNTNTGELQRMLKGHKADITAIAFSPDRTMLASASYDGTIKLWETGAALLQQQTLESHSSYVEDLVFSPDGTKLASSSENFEVTTVKLWDAETGALIHTINVTTLRFRSTLAFSEDGATLRVGGLKLPWKIAEPAKLSANPLKTPLPVNIQDRWVYLHTRRVLWLPSEYWANKVAIHGGVVALGCPSGRVVLMEFAL